MPKITHKGKTFLLRWKKEWWDILDKVAKKYREKGGRRRIQWKLAEADGALDGFPSDFSLRDIGKAYSTKNSRRKNKKKHLDYNKKYYQNNKKMYSKASKRSVVRDRKLFDKDVPEELKKELIYKMWLDKKTILNTRRNAKNEFLSAKIPVREINAKKEKA